MATVVRSTVIDAPIEAVWAVLRDFNGHDRWHPAVAESEIENGEPADMVGAVRHFRLADGAVLREQLLALNDRVHSFTYCLLEAPIPLIDYVATVSLKPVTMGNATYWRWQSRFNPPPEDAARLVRLVGDDIYRAGFEAIRALVAQPAQRTAAPAPLAPAAPTPSTRQPVGEAIAGRAIVVRRHGGPEVLSLEDVAVPPPGPGELRIAQVAAGVNFIDVHGRAGSSATLATLPAIPGMEGAGRVLDVGEGVRGFAPGDRIAYAGGPPGAYASHRLLPAEVAVPLPDDIDEAVAAASLLRGMTAAAVLTRIVRPADGDWVLVQAASGGLGQILCQWARALGARVIGTVSTAEKRAAVAGLADHVLVRADADVAAEVKALTGGRGVAAAFDGIGRDTFAASVASLGSRGHLVLYGRVSGPVGAQDLEALGRRSLTVSRPNFADYADSAESRRALADAYFDMLRRGAINVEISERAPLADAARIHEQMESGQNVGSAVLWMGGRQ